ncbi:MAG: ABC transporter ATP-binding protein [Anaerolineae bacterium]|nr:ABC transporter ATP-binding protein [Anaerolineae bacterium]
MSAWTAPRAPDSAEPFLCVEGVSVTFPSPQGGLGALDDVTFAVREGEFVCMVGPSGGGKSTLLRVMSGLLPPTRGRVRLRGAPLQGPSNQIGIVFQNSNLMPWRTVLRNITLPLDLQGLNGERARQLATDLIALVGLEGFEHSYPDELSGGMAQRVAIARALIHDPAILMMDEPFGALDALTRERMTLELLRIWEARRKTVFMVTHNIQEAILLSDRVVVMTERPGRIISDVMVTLPRPRSQELVYDEAFIRLSRCIHDAIREQRVCDRHGEAT